MFSTPSHSQSWSLDALGNWSSVTTDGSTQTRTANQQNEITSISGQTTPGYDNNGNTTTDQNGHTLIFDAWNRLVQVKNGSTVLETYSYDLLGRRITENPGTIRDLYYSMLWQLLEEDVSGSMQDQYVWSPVYVDALIERDTPTQRMYVEQDANFNVTALVDTSGNVQERYIYDPFGSMTILAANWTTRGSSNYSWVYGHQGGRYDNATGLYAFRNRDYSPTLGRWVENDPVGFAGGDPNLYRSLSNDPTSLRDPSGFAADDGSGNIVVPKPVNRPSIPWYNSPWIIGARPTEPKPEEPPIIDVSPRPGDKPRPRPWSGPQWGVITPPMTGPFQTPANTPSPIPSPSPVPSPSPAPPGSMNEGPWPGNWKPNQPNPGYPPGYWTDYQTWLANEPPLPARPTPAQQAAYQSWLGQRPRPPGSPGGWRPPTGGLRPPTGIFIDWLLLVPRPILESVFPILRPHDPTFMRPCDGGGWS